MRFGIPDQLQTFLEGQALFGSKCQSVTVLEDAVTGLAVDVGSGVNAQLDGCCRPAGALDLNELSDRFGGRTGGHEERVLKGNAADRNRDPDILGGLLHGLHLQFVVLYVNAFLGRFVDQVDDLQGLQPDFGRQNFDILFVHGEYLPFLLLLNNTKLNFLDEMDSKSKIIFKTHHAIARYDGIQIDIAGQEKPFGLKLYWKRG